MSNKVSGVVGWVGSKDIRGRKYWSFRIDGNDNWFRTGSDKPPLKNGDNVSFAYEETQYGNQVAIDSIKVSADAPPASGASSSGGASSRDDYWSRKEETDQFVQRMIQFNHCTNAAVSVAKLALDAGILPLGSGSKAGKMDALLAQVSAIRNALYDEVEDFSGALAKHKEAFGNLDMRTSMRASASPDELSDADFEDN